MFEDGFEYGSILGMGWYLQLTTFIYALLLAFIFKQPVQMKQTFYSCTSESFLKGLSQQLYWHIDDDGGDDSSGGGGGGDNDDGDRMLVKRDKTMFKFEP